jgi:tRNA pseudouridine55 synthase
MGRRRNKGRAVTGILLLDKPPGLTSNKALQRAKSLFGARKAGHTGSLDPLATGALPLCFGEATKVSSFLLDADKYYRVTAAFGVITDTGDADGTVVERRHVPRLDASEVRAATHALTGDMEQVPPMYSAVKQGGKRLYELAREGHSVEREARSVTVYDFELSELGDDTATFTVHCAKGTYVRTLIEDLGDKLGVGAHVAALRRTAVPPFDANARLVTLDELEQANEASGHHALDALLLPADTALADYAAVQLNDDLARYVRHGQAVWMPQAPEPGWVRLYDAEATFLGMGEALDDARVAPRRLMTGSR